MFSYTTTSIDYCSEFIQAEIKKAYRKASVQNHPDKGGDPEKFKEMLSNEKARFVHEPKFCRQIILYKSRQILPIILLWEPLWLCLEQLGRLIVKESKMCYNRIHWLWGPFLTQAYTTSCSLLGSHFLLICLSSLRHHFALGAITLIRVRCFQRWYWNNCKFWASNNRSFSRRSWLPGHTLDKPFFGTCPFIQTWYGMGCHG